MNAIVKAVSNKVLGLFVSELEAGACIPFNGEACKPCSRRKYLWLYNCSGVCQQTKVRC